MSVHNRKGEDLLSEMERLRPDAPDIHLIHRLDAGTSGIVLVATDKQIATQLHEQFSQRTVQKEYLAIARVVKNAPTEGDSGVWKQALTKKAESRRNPRGWSGARVPCQTAWWVTKIAGNRVHLYLKPLTGRKHQIRRHAAVAGWPLVGDYRYGSAPKEGDEEVPLALHAWKLTFFDPESESRVEVESVTDSISGYRPEFF